MSDLTVSCPNCKRSFEVNLEFICQYGPSEWKLTCPVCKAIDFVIKVRSNFKPEEARRP
jgi:hypothetical protein